MDSRRPRMSTSDELRYCRNALADALAERDAEQARNATLADTAERLRVRLHTIHDLWREWQHGEYSATELEPGIAYCADRLPPIACPSSNRRRLRGRMVGARGGGGESEGRVR